MLLKAKQCLSKRNCAFKSRPLRKATGTHHDFDLGIDRSGMRIRGAVVVVVVVVVVVIVIVVVVVDDDDDFVDVVVDVVSSNPKDLRIL